MPRISIRKDISDKCPLNRVPVGLSLHRKTRVEVIRRVTSSQSDHIGWKTSAKQVWIPVYGRTSLPLHPMHDLCSCVHTSIRSPRTENLHGISQRPLKDTLQSALNSS